MIQSFRSAYNSIIAVSTHVVTLLSILFLIYCMRTPKDRLRGKASIHQDDLLLPPFLDFPLINYWYLLCTTKWIAANKMVCTSIRANCRCSQRRWKETACWKEGGEKECREDSRVDVLYQRTLRMIVSTATKISLNSIYLANSRMGRQTYKEVGRVEREGVGIDKYIINIIYIYMQPLYLLAPLECRKGPPEPANSRSLRRVSANPSASRTGSNKSVAHDSHLKRRRQEFEREDNCWAAALGTHTKGCLSCWIPLSMYYHSVLDANCGV